MWPASERSTVTDAKSTKRSLPSAPCSHSGCKCGCLSTNASPPPLCSTEVMGSCRRTPCMVVCSCGLPSTRGVNDPNGVCHARPARLQYNSSEASSIEGGQAKKIPTSGIGDGRHCMPAVWRRLPRPAPALHTSPVQHSALWCKRLIGGTVCIL